MIRHSILVDTDYRYKKRENEKTKKTSKPVSRQPMESLTGQSKILKVIKRVKNIGRK